MGRFTTEDRLRAAAIQLDRNCWSGEANLCRNAADEIQSLRAEVEQKEKEFSRMEQAWRDQRRRRLDAEAAIDAVRALPDKWRDEGPCAEWEGLQWAAEQLEQALVPR